MKLVNAENPNMKAHKIYHKIPQPMPIYHSFDELQMNEARYTVISKDDLYEKFKAVTFAPESYIYPIREKLYIATNERFVPQTFTKEGFIIYETVGMNVRRTDNCYIRLYYLVYMPGGSKNLITSSGVWSLILLLNI